MSRFVIMAALAAFTFSLPAMAGGNPDENQDGAMTRERLPASTVILPVQPSPTPIEEPEYEKAEPTQEPTEEPTPITLARASAVPECTLPFSWFNDCDASMFVDHNPSPTGYHFVDGVEEVPTERTVKETKTDRVFKKHRSLYKAIRHARKLKKDGYEVRVFKSRHKRFYSKRHKSWVVKGTKEYVEVTVVRGTKLVPVLVRVRGDRNGGGKSTTSQDSNFGDGRQNGRGDTPD